VGKLDYPEDMFVYCKLPVLWNERISIRSSTIAWKPYS